MIKYLREHELVNPDADDQQIGGFLAKQISAKSGYEFYAFLRQESESAKSKSKIKTKTTRKKKTEAKAPGESKTKRRRKK